MILSMGVCEDAEARRGRRRSKGFRNIQFTRGCGSLFCRPRAGSVLRNQDINNQFNNFGLTPVVDAPNLVKDGKVLRERILSSNGVPIVTDLIIQRDGRLTGALDPVNTIRQLRETYLKTLDKFGIDLDDVCFRNGNRRRNLAGNAAVVTRFLRANGGCDNVLGNVTIDLSTFGVNEEYDGMSKTEAGRRILNMLVNSLSTNPKLFNLNRNLIRSDGTVAVPNLNEFLRSDALSLALSDNPFTKCGKPIPLQWLVDRVMNPEIYYRLLGIPEKIGDLGQRLGVFTDKTQTQGNKILVYSPPGKPKESVPGLASQRILERQPQQGDFSGKNDNILLGRPGGSFYASWDFINDPAPGLATEARNVFNPNTGIKATNDASEMLWQLPNGLMAGALYDGNGKRQNAAPINVAQGGALLTISPMGACLDCHRDGYNGGGIIPDGSNRRYTDVFAANSPHPKVDPFSRKFFAAGGNPEYRAQADRDSADIVARQNASDSRIVVGGKTRAGITDVMVKYKQDLKEEDQARELKLPPGSRNGKGVMSRSAFDEAFCGLAGGSRPRGRISASQVLFDELARRDGSTRGTAHGTFPSRR